MTGIDVSRSVRFVSLDTHPANNSLVVTYEIIVVVTDSNDGHELTRRAKRDQLQISISALDNLNQSDLKRPANKLTLNLRQLSEQIIDKCPVLHSIDASSQALEDIQLHLLYLSNRKQSQLYQANTDRPGSSASSRLRSATPSASRLIGARQGSALSRLAASDNRKSSPSDVYTALCEKELKYGGPESCSNLESSIRLDGFMGQFEMHLNEQEEAIATEIQSELRLNHSNLAQNNLEAQLEGLYGDTMEKRIAMAIIRRHIGNDHFLANMNESRLLVCALLRSLQDHSDTKDATISKSILFCLIRFTQFEDIYMRLFSYSPTDAIDPMKVVIDLLEEHVILSVAAKQDSLAQFVAHFYHINSLIVILNNLLSLDSNNKGTRLTKKLIQQHGKRLATIMVGLFALISRHMASIIRQQTTNKYERLTLIVSELIRLSQCLSIYKEFVYLLRLKSQALVDAQTTILNTLQLCRPGSGSIQSAPAAKKPADLLLLVRDQDVLSEIYEIEIELLRLMNNLIYDSRFKARLLRKSLLLKCVLRNLVVFLASSRRSNTLTPFHRSSVLLVPFKSLYELSCSNQIKEELFKSKLITKCLFEYLLSSIADLKTILDSIATTTTATTASVPANSARAIDGNSIQPIVDDDQIVLNPTQADHYINAIWINLSANKSAPFYRINSTADTVGELQEPLCEYLDLSTQILSEFVSILDLDGPGGVRGGGMRHVSRNLGDAQLMLYTHAKLLRNLTQFLVFPRLHKQSTSSLAWASYYTRWVDRIAGLIDHLLVQSCHNHSRKGFVEPMLVECLAILANLVDKSSAFWQESKEGSEGDQQQTQLIPALNWPKELESILSKLFQVSLPVGANMDGEHDDLLLVAINLLGTLARYREICYELKSIAVSIIEISNFILDSKSTDSEMIISCLYTLSQLVNHSVFLKTVSFSLEDDGQITATHLLVDKLANLIMHDDLSASKSANSILNSLKQFEEQQSLSDSVTCKRRFMCYNSKWLNAIRANHDDPTVARTTGGSGLDASETDLAKFVDDDPFGTLNSAKSDKKGRINGSEEGVEEEDFIDRGLDLIEDDFNQLRTINEDSRSRMSATSSNRSSNLPAEDKEYDSENGESQAGKEMSKRAQGDGHDGGNEDCDEDEYDDDYDEEENFSEPDLNVIDPNSMIKHLTNRREFRSEILMRK